MRPVKSGLDTAFVKKQHQLRLRLRATLTTASNADQSEAADVKARGGAALEAEEDAQELDTLEREDNLLGRSIVRLEQVTRAWFVGQERQTDRKEETRSGSRGALHPN